MDLEYLKSLILNSETGNIEKKDKDELINLIRPTIGVKSYNCNEDQIAVGNSKIGGYPDLPSGFQWPQNNGKPSLFTAQYNLAELKKYDNDDILPSTGLLSIFLNEDHQYGGFDLVNSSHHFFYFDSKELERVKNPNKHFKSAKIEFYSFYTIPHHESHYLSDYERKYGNELFLFYDELDSYVRDIWLQDIDNFHQILGYDRSIQSSVLYDFAASHLGLLNVDHKEFKRRWNDIYKLSHDYELLLQLDCSDENTDLINFCNGVLYIGINKRDLRNKAFEESIICFQLD